MARFEIRRTDARFGEMIFYGFSGGTIPSWGPSSVYGDKYETRSAAEKVAKRLRAGRRGTGIRVEEIS